MIKVRLGHRLVSLVNLLAAMVVLYGAVCEGACRLICDISETVPAQRTAQAHSCCRAVAKESSQCLATLKSVENGCCSWIGKKVDPFAISSKANVKPVDQWIAVVPETIGDLPFILARTISVCVAHSDRAPPDRIRSTNTSRAPPLVC